MGDFQFLATFWLLSLRLIFAFKVVVKWNISGRVSQKVDGCVLREGHRDVTT